MVTSAAAVTAWLAICSNSGSEFDVERRRTPRFEVRVPVIFEWRDESGSFRRDAGFTRDMSRNGVFAWCEGERPPWHAEITMAMIFPGIGPDAKPWRMRSTGRVVRTHDAQQGKGFAATLDDLGTAVLDDNPPWSRVQ
jgi:hypothetical protein